MRSPRPWSGLLLLFAILGNVALGMVAVQHAHRLASMEARMTRAEHAPRVVGFDADGNPVVSADVIDVPLPPRAPTSEVP